MYRKSATTWRYPLGLLAVYGVIWFALALDPVYRDDWLLENLIVFVAVPLFALTAHRLRFSNFAYTCLFVFFVMHAIGSHYTYSLVPYAEWWQWLGGGALEGRNHYDRLVHFAYGLLVTPTAVEIFAHYGRYPRPWVFLFPWMFMAGHAVIYELIEFAAALVFGGDLGQAYLGTQGDVWDGQKDMALALLGTTLMLAALGAAGRLPTREGRKGTLP
jgi:putative membrane protein